MPYRLEFRLEGLPRMNANGTHGSWRRVYGENKLWKHKTYSAILAYLPAEPLERAHAVFTRHSARQPDCDNLAISFKSVRDALKTHVIVDDSPARFTAEYRWQKAKHGKGFVTVTVEAA